ncbi:MAG: hypothetical protein LBH20_03615, partial [Treponema sp.]|nr:hypothetical protein [Treponema sp.]
DIETVLGGFPVPGNNLAEKLEWLKKNTESNKSYLVAVNANESLNPTVLDYNIYFIDYYIVTSKNNITIKLQGIGGEKTISLLSNGSLFTIGSGVTLVMDNNITLQGRISNTSDPVIKVREGGKLIMNGGVISGNGEWGVDVYDGGTLTKNGGTIYGANESDTSLRNRGAVYVFSPRRTRYNTAGPSVHLDSTKSKAEGGGWD